MNLVDLTQNGVGHVSTAAVVPVVGAVEVRSRAAHTVVSHSQIREQLVLVRVVGGVGVHGVTRARPPPPPLLSPSLGVVPVRTV